mgnify:CR=1 FL=1
MTPVAHLSEADLADLIDLVDGTAGDERRRHAASCETCRVRLAELRAVWTLVRSDEAPDPSPLFWNHFSARVGEAVRQQAVAPRRVPGWWWSFAAVPAVLVVLALVVVWRTAPPVAAPSPAVASLGPAGVETAGPSDAGLVLAGDDESWELVALLSESLADVEGEGLEPRLGAADRALGQLSRDEQETLARLLAEEMGGGPS